MDNPQNQHQPETLPLPDDGQNIAMVPQCNPPVVQTNSHHPGMVPAQVPYMGQPPMYPYTIPNAMMTIPQGPPIQLQPQIRDWSSGLMDCFDEWTSCLLGGLCPCILAMTISCSADECCCVGNCYPVALRTGIRTQHNIEGSICEDGYVMCCCFPCALCQIAREIDARTPET